jgi:DNA polymerase-3 subunit epsilon
MLHCEFTRVGGTLSLEGRAIIDALEIFHHFERRDLAAAVRMYLGRDHEGGHAAAADVLATAAVLDAMVVRYPDLPRNVLALHQQFADPTCVDSDGFFKRIEGQIRLVKGPHRGQPLDTVAAESPGFLEWMLGKDFPDDTLRIVRDALARVRFAGRAESRRAITPA